MLNDIKFLPLLLSSAFILSGCNGDDSDFDEEVENIPVQILYANTDVYAKIRSDSVTVDSLFGLVELSVLEAGGSGELCDVKVTRLSYDTVGSTGESATSSGVFMTPMPTEGNELCSGPRPVVLYAHGTNTDSVYDLSQFPIDESNPANAEAILLLATYASQGYAVIAPNYAGYADSDLGYHPYLDEVQQSTEMIDALNHAREYADILGAELSSDLFITGLSQGGYVAMATHKILQEQGETVTASMPVSGPYATLDFMDNVFAGYVNAGSTSFAPMYLTALDRAHDIYDDANEIYAEQYADFADNILPRPGGFAESGLPEYQLFSGEPPVDADEFHTLGFGEDHLLADSFRSAYLADAQANPFTPEYDIRALVQEADLRDWSPTSPLLMCGASDDPVVYHGINSDAMETYWSSLVAAGLVINLDLTDIPDASNPFAPVQVAWQGAGIDVTSVHSQTGAYCSFAGLSYFNSLSSN